jgi:hypothetical protein
MQSPCLRTFSGSYLQVIMPLGLVPCDRQWGINAGLGIPHSAATTRL